MQSRITIVAFLCLTVFLCFFLIVMTGCGNRISGEENNTENVEITETENTEEATEWAVTHTKLNMTLNKAVFYEDTLFGATEEEGGIRITEYDLTDMDKKQDFFVDAIDNVSSISAKGNGNVVVLGQKGEGFALLEISDEGIVSETNDIQLEKMGLWPELKGVFFSDDGYCFIWYGMSVLSTEVLEIGEEGIYSLVDRIYVLNEDMETVSYDEVPGSYGYRLISLLFDDKGHPIFLAKDEEGYFEKTVRLSDEEDKEIVRLDLDFYNFDLANCSNIIMAENGFAYISKGDICSFSTETGIEERLFHLATAGLSETDIVSWQMNDGEIKIVDNYSGGENTEVTIIREGESDKTVLKIAVMSLGESTRNIISSFNRYSDTIQLEPVVYVENYDYDGGAEKLRLDIIQGKAPDLFFGGDEELAAKGAFVNLNDYIKEDDELTSDKIVSSIFDAYGSGDNLYVLAPAFIIHTMWGAQSTVGDISGVNLDELTEILKARGEDINSIYGLATCDMFAYLLTATILADESYYSFIFTIIFMLLIERILGSVLRKGRAWKIVGREMVLMTGFPLLSAVILYCITSMGGAGYKLVASVAVLLISILSIVVYERMMEKIELNWKKELLEKRIDGYRHELDTMKNSERRMQNLRHDLRHHFIEMESLANQGKTNELCEYIHDMEKTFADTKRIVHTGEYETDSLVNFLLADAQNRGIEISTGISMPEDLNISKFKINVILGNLLENAIEAASKSKDKKLVLKMNYAGGTILLIIKNTYSGNIIIENGMVKSKNTAREHGIGLRSVRDIVEEQDGRMEICTDGEWFTAEIMIMAE